MPGIHLALHRPAPGSRKGRCVVRLDDPKLLGHQAELSVVAEVEVHDSRGIDEKKTLFSKSFRIDTFDFEIPVPASGLRCYCHSGEHIDVTVHARLVIDDGLVFDTSYTVDQQLAAPERGTLELELAEEPRLRSDAEALLDPEDEFDLLANLQAIPVGNQALAVGVMLLMAILIALNTVAGLHDQLSPQEATWIYIHVESDGEGRLPIVDSLGVSAGIGALLWIALRHQLRKYLRVRLWGIGTPRRDTVVSAHRLVHGISRQPLKDVVVRVVAANRERGQYKRGSGSKTRIVSFAEPVRAIKLYEWYLPEVPAGTPLQYHLEGEVSFEPMFAALLPPLMVGKEHGIDVVWEVQILHPTYVDHELCGDCERLAYEDFLQS